MGNSTAGATWRDFTIDSVQTAIFTPDHSVFAAGRVVATILQRFGDQFSGDMQALPFGADVPPELPRVVLQSSDGFRRLQIGPARFDCLWNRQSSDTSNELVDLVRSASEVQEHYQRATSVRIGRVGLIVRRVYPEPTPALTLIQRFCNEASQAEPFNRSATFEIHNHKEYALSRNGLDCKINSWVRCKSARLMTSNSPVILVEQDMNTMANDLEILHFDAEQIHVFFEAAACEADDIFRKYFPN